MTAPLNVVQIKYVKMTFQTNNINGPANHKDNLEFLFSEKKSALAVSMCFFKF